MLLLDTTLEWNRYGTGSTESYCWSFCCSCSCRQLDSPVLCGMHVALVPFVVTSFATLGYDTFIVPAMFAGSWATFGCMLAVLVLVKDKKKRALYSGYVFAWLIGGVGEPYKYGVQIPYRTPLYASVVSGLLTG